MAAHVPHSALQNTVMLTMLFCYEVLHDSRCNLVWFDLKIVLFKRQICFWLEKESNRLNACRYQKIPSGIILWGPIWIFLVLSLLQRPLNVTARSDTGIHLDVRRKIPSAGVRAVFQRPIILGSFIMFYPYLSLKLQCSASLLTRCGSNESWRSEG